MGLLVGAFLSLVLSGALNKQSAKQGRRDIKTLQAIGESHSNICPDPCILALEETAHRQSCLRPHALSSILILQVLPPSWHQNWIFRSLSTQRLLDDAVHDKTSGSHGHNQLFALLLLWKSGFLGPKQSYVRYCVSEATLSPKMMLMGEKWQVKKTNSSPECLFHVGKSSAIHDWRDVV